jgi:hypothetical protein
MRDTPIRSDPGVESGLDREEEASKRRTKKRKKQTAQERGPESDHVEEERETGRESGHGGERRAETAKTAMHSTPRGAGETVSPVMTLSPLPRRHPTP